MSATLPALLAGAAAAAATGLPAPSVLRLRGLLSGTGDRGVGHGGSRAGRPWSGPRVPLAAALLLAGVALLGPGPALLMAAAAAVGRRARLVRARSHARLVERRHAVEACTGLAAELRAGRTPAQALDVAAGLARGPSSAALRAAGAAARWGGDVPAALLTGAGTATAVPEVLRGLAACWLVCAQAGSGLAAAVERLADGQRARQVHGQAVAAALAGPKASAALLALLPLAGTALAAGLGARPLHVLLHTPVGLACLVSGLGLDAAGLWWTGRIVARAAEAGT